MLADLEDEDLTLETGEPESEIPDPEAVEAELERFRHGRSPFYTFAST